MEARRTSQAHSARPHLPKSALSGIIKEIGFCSAEVHLKMPPVVIDLRQRGRLARRGAPDGPGPGGRQAGGLSHGDRLRPGGQRDGRRGGRAAGGGQGPPGGPCPDAGRQECRRGPRLRARHDSAGPAAGAALLAGTGHAGGRRFAPGEPGAAAPAARSSSTSSPSDTLGLRVPGHQVLLGRAADAGRAAGPDQREPQRAAGGGHGREVLDGPGRHGRPGAGRRPLPLRRALVGRPRPRQPLRDPPGGRGAGKDAPAALQPDDPVRLHGQHLPQPDGRGHLPPAAGPAAGLPRPTSWRTAACW